MFDEDRVKAAEVDAELDAIEAAEAIVYESASGTSGASAPSRASAAGDEDDVDASTPVSISHTSSGAADGSAAGEEAKRSRPWWESDPVLGRRMGFLEDE